MASIPLSTTTTTSTQSTLRSRQKRTGAASASTPPSRPSSIRSSSAASLPASHLTRRDSSRDKSKADTNGASKGQTNLRSVFPNSITASGVNLNGPWSKLQNFASTIGNEILGLSEPSQPGTGAGDLRNDAANRRRRKMARTASDGGITAMLANGQRTKREEQLCRKLEEDADEWMKDRGKRSRSPEPEERRSGDGSGDRQALVYVHEVRKTDTLEGIVLLYNISSAALRRANRLWPGDSVQSRKHLFLPVTECLSRGRRLTPEEEATLPTDNPDASQFTHDSYVQLPGIKHPVEIIRLQSSTLTHFPPRRRALSRASTSTPASSPSPTRTISHIPASVFFEPGVHPLDGKVRPGEQIPLDVQLDLGKMLDGVEKGVSVVEGFIRGLTKKAGEVVEGELIELTQGFRISEEERDRARENVSDRVTEGLSSGRPSTTETLWERRRRNLSQATTLVGE